MVWSRGDPTLDRAIDAIGPGSSSTKSSSRSPPYRRRGELTASAGVDRPAMAGVRGCHGWLPGASTSAPALLKSLRGGSRRREKWRMQKRGGSGNFSQGTGQRLAEAWGGERSPPQGGRQQESENHQGGKQQGGCEGNAGQPNPSEERMVSPGQEHHAPAARLRSRGWSGFSNRAAEQEMRHGESFQGYSRRLTISSSTDSRRMSTTPRTRS